MGELRDRMEADLRLRGLSENTRRLVVTQLLSHYPRGREGR